MTNRIERVEYVNGGFRVKELDEKHRLISDSFYDNNTSDITKYQYSENSCTASEINRIKTIKSNNDIISYSRDFTKYDCNNNLIFTDNEEIDYNKGEVVKYLSHVETRIYDGNILRETFVKTITDDIRINHFATYEPNGMRICSEEKQITTINLGKKMNRAKKLN